MMETIAYINKSNIEVSLQRKKHQNRMSQRLSSWLRSPW